MVITLIRSGGVSGIPIKKTLETKTLPAKLGEQIESLANICLAQKPRDFVSKKGRPDRFTYKILIQEESISTSLDIDESSMTEELRKLIAYIVKI